MAAASGSRDVGFYKCEECSKSFNRMASYEAHIRMHAEDELDILDVVFNYSGKMHENVTAASTDRRETRSKTARSSKKSTTITKSSPPQRESPTNQTPLSPLKAQRESLAGSVESSAALKIVDLLLDRDTLGNVASVTTSASEDLSTAQHGEAYSKPPLIVTLPATKVLRGGYTPDQRVLEPPTTIGARECDSDESLPLLVKVPLKFCSAGVLGRPVINLTKQTGWVESQLQSVSSSSSSTLTPAHLPPSTLSSQTETNDHTLHQHSNGLPHNIVGKNTSPSIDYPPSPPKKVSRIIRLDSVGLPEMSDLSEQLCSKKGATICIKKRKPTTSARFECSICHRLLSSRSSLKRHNMLHTGEKPFKCTICDRTFTQPHHRQNHEMTHYVSMRDQNLMVSSSSFVKLHGPGGSVSSSVSSCSPENEVRMYKCHICWMTFVSVRSLRKHLTIHDTKRSFHCELCGMWFLKKDHLAYHVQAFHTPRRYCCQHCPKKYSRPEYLKRHMLQHTREDTTTNTTTGEIKYQCKFCPKVCCSLSGLTRHQAVHVTSPDKFKGKVRKTGKVISPHLEENGKIMAIREMFPTEREEIGKPLSIREGGSAFSSSDLVLELDSDSESEMSVALTDTESDGELTDVSNSGVDGTTEESTEEMMEVGSEGMNGVECNGEEGEESEGEMSPLRLDSSDESTEDDDNDYGSYDDDHYRQFIQCSSSGVKSNTPYRNPHNHHKSNGGTPQFKCEWCGRLFLKKDYLRQHYNLHQQVPHQCHICGKVFMSRRYLKRHLHGKHNE